MTQYYPTFQGNMTAAGMSGLEGFDLDIPQQFRNDNNVPPWAPMNLKNEDFASAIVDETNSFTSQSPRQRSPTHSSHHSSPRSPYVKAEPGKGASPIRKVRNGYKVEKKKSESSSKFVIMTPNLINQQSGKPNPFECFEAMRTTQRGRKGPLAHDTKESALQVRRLGACFCCHRCVSPPPHVILAYRQLTFTSTAAKSNATKSDHARTARSYPLKYHRLCAGNSAISYRCCSQTSSEITSKRIR